MKAWLAICAGLAGSVSASAQVLITNFPVADTFVRSVAPASNYGGSGSSGVSGPIATNALGQQNGLLDTFMRFDMAGTVSNLNGAFGAGKWAVARATLVLFEQGAPNNVIFNRGVGPFEVRWIANDSWVEGTGIPNIPATDGIVWNDKPTILNPLVDQSLGSFLNGGTDGVVRTTLGMPASFAADLTSGGLASFYLVATTNSPVGFTFRSRSFSDSTQRPFLEIAAVAPPRITSVLIAGADVKIGFVASGSVTNTVEYNDDLSTTNWNPLASLLGTGDNTNVVDVGGALLPKRFYRVRLTVPD